MLLQLMPEAVSRGWHEVKPHVIKALDNPDEDTMTTVLTNVLAGHIQVWISYDEQDEQRIPNAIALTRVQICEFTGRKTLLLYSVTRIQSISKEVTDRMWMEAFIATSKYAIARGCVGLVAITELDYLADKARNLGVDTKVKYLIDIPLGG